MGFASASRISRDSCQAGAEHFQQCAEFALLCNRGLGPLAVTVLPIPLARRAAAITCAVRASVRANRARGSSDGLIVVAGKSISASHCPQRKTPALGARVSRRMGEGLGAGGHPTGVARLTPRRPPVPCLRDYFRAQPIGYMLDTTEFNAVAKGMSPSLREKPLEGGATQKHDPGNRIRCASRRAPLRNPRQCREGRCTMASISRAAFTQPCAGW